MRQVQPAINTGDAPRCCGCGLQRSEAQSAVPRSRDSSNDFCQSPNRDLVAIHLPSHRSHTLRNMTIHVTDLTEADIPGAVKAVQQAFNGDPYNVWVYDQSKEASTWTRINELTSIRHQFSQERNYASLALRMRWGMRNGIFHVAKEEGSDKVVGVAMWLRPRPADAPPTWNDWFEGWRLWFGQVNYNMWHGRGGLNVKRYYIWKDAQAKAQQELWTDPRGYYFLNIMVVLPEAQGKGVGTKMMKAVTDQADAEDMKCYLESSKDVPNTAIYGRWGFTFQKEMICDDDGDAIRLFTMIREPGAEPGNGRGQPRNG
ncbi:acetyltransferase [Colletotrichum incanum]|uniref:Acetyltransferase n=1 Tax=Colletotrichum incanum TaxID=1573173 RepID=A0A167BG16_COLIC|nr:acetyltransferase [Colletotrichum incanum]